MFVRFRHYAVMAVAYKRSKDYFNATINVIKMVLTSPLDFLSEVIKYKIIISKYKGLER